MCYNYTTWGLLCHLPFLFKMHHTFPYVQFYSILKHHVQRWIILTILCNNDVIAFTDILIMFIIPCRIVRISMVNCFNLYPKIWQHCSRRLINCKRSALKLLWHPSQNRGCHMEFYVHVACFLVTYAAHSRHLFLFISLLITRQSQGPFYLAPDKWLRI